MSKPKTLRQEISTSGVDESLQNVSSDPFTSLAIGSYTGLRIPPVLSAAATPATQPRYLFLLASTTFQRGIRLLGLRQGLTIGIDANLGSPPERPVEMWVQTPTFKFPDGNVSWHLMLERQPNRKTRTPSTDTRNWTFLQGDSPAMLYQTFTNTNVDATTGAPLLSLVGLTAYTPPDLTGVTESVGGLGTFRDLRFPWDSASAWRSMGEDGLYIPGGGRLSFYASVLQTNPATRDSLPTKQMTTISSSNLPEESFIQDYNVPAGEQAPAKGPVYWRIMGSLIVEKEVPP